MRQKRQYKKKKPKKGAEEFRRFIKTKFCKKNPQTGTGVAKVIACLLENVADIIGV